MASPSQRAQRGRKLPPGSRGFKARLFDKRHAILIFLCLSLLTAAVLHFSTDKIADPDVLYHFRHAEIYGAAGIFAADFPWARYSVISQYSADIWYGFHLLLIPFTWSADPIFGLQLAGVLITSMFLLLIYIACSTLEIKLAPLWPFFMLFSSFLLLHRLTMQRPHVLSLGLNILLFVFAAAGNVWGVFFTALASTFLHLSLFVISFLIVGVFAVVKLFCQKQFPWRECLAAAAGILCGWLLRPNPWGAAKIAYVQVFQLSLEKFRGVPLNFGSELLPLRFTPRNNFWLFTLVWLCILLFVLWKVLPRREPLAGNLRTVLLASASLSAVFLLMSLFFARRSFEFFSGFGVVLTGLVFSNFLYERQLARMALIYLSMILVPYSFFQRGLALDSSGKDPHRFESSARWLETNSEAGEIVFNINWDLFPELFFWNKKNLYVGGMDPIFQYAYRPELYWEGYHLSRHKADPLTCGAAACNEANSKQIYDALKKDFGARYLFLLKSADLPLYYHLLDDPRFSLKNENQISAVFEIK